MCVCVETELDIFLPRGVWEYGSRQCWNGARWELILSPCLHNVNNPKKMCVCVCVCVCVCACACVCVCVWVLGVLCMPVYKQTLEFAEVKGLFYTMVSCAVHVWARACL